MQSKFSPSCRAFVESLMAGAVCTAGYRYIGLMPEDRLLYPELSNVVKLTQSPGGEIVGRNNREWTEFVIEVRNASNEQAEDTARLEFIFEHRLKFDVDGKGRPRCRFTAQGQRYGVARSTYREALDEVRRTLPTYLQQTEGQENGDDNL